MLLRLETVAADGLILPDVDYALLSRSLGSFAENHAPGGCREMSAALSFVPPVRIRELNAQYRKLDEETDVLSFPLWETSGAFSPPDGWDDLPLGDIVVSPEYVFNSAKERKIDYNGEIALMIIHGALHLLGFDHDSRERELEMWRAQDALLNEYLSLNGKA